MWMEIPENLEDPQVMKKTMVKLIHEINALKSERNKFQETEMEKINIRLHNLELHNGFDFQPSGSQSYHRIDNATLELSSTEKGGQNTNPPV